MTGSVQRARLVADTGLQPSAADLPISLGGKTGWPWTEESPQMSDAMVRQERPPDPAIARRPGLLSAGQSASDPRNGGGHTQVWLLRLLVGALAVVVAIASREVLARAQTEPPGIRCSELEVVFRDDSGSAEVRPAAIVADPAGVAHLFWLYQEDRNDRSSWAVSYLRWQNGIWAAPNDVLVSPGGGAGAPRVALDSEDRLHVIWADGDLYYSSSPAPTAGDAHSWSEPVAIARALEGDIAVDQTGRLHVVFTTGQDGESPQYSHTLEYGGWSPPAAVSRGGMSNAAAGSPRLSSDGRGRIHVTWTQHQLPGGWPPLGQWYARSDDGGSTWEMSSELARGEQGQGTVLAIGGDEIHLVWRGTTGAGGTYHQWSTDGGIVWHGPIVFDPDGGFSGAQSLAADSAGNIHLVRGDGGYQVWRDGGWSPVPAEFADSGETGTLAIGLGNQVHWVNTMPSSSSVAIVWHRLCEADSPRAVGAAPAGALPTSEPPLELEPTITPTTFVNPPCDTCGDAGSSDATVPSQVGRPSLLGALVGLVFLGAVLLARSRLRNGKGGAW